MLYTCFGQASLKMKVGGDHVYESSISEEVKESLDTPTKAIIRMMRWNYSSIGSDTCMHRYTCRQNPHTHKIKWIFLKINKISA